MESGNRLFARKQPFSFAPFEETKLVRSQPSKQSASEAPVESEPYDLGDSHHTSATANALINLGAQSRAKFSIHAPSCIEHTARKSRNGRAGQMRIDSFDWPEWEFWADRLVTEHRAGCQHGVVLISVSMIELLLDRLLKETKDTNNIAIELQKISFSEKIRISCDEALLHKNFRNILHTIRIIRNEFAHRYDADINDKVLVRKIAACLGDTDDGGIEHYDSLTRFRIAVELVVSALVEAIIKAINKHGSNNII